MGEQGVEDAEDGGGVHDHHRHCSGRCDVPGIVHVEDGDRGEHGFRRVEEDHGRDSGHRVEEEVTAHIEQRGQTDGQRHLAHRAPHRGFQRKGDRLEFRIKLLEYELKH